LNVKKKHVIENRRFISDLLNAKWNAKSTFKYFVMLILYIRKIHRTMDFSRCVVIDMQLTSSVLVDTQNAVHTGLVLRLIDSAMV
jgi:hypothetical protein